MCTSYFGNNQDINLIPKIGGTHFKILNCIIKSDKYIKKKDTYDPLS